MHSNAQSVLVLGAALLLGGCFEIDLHDDQKSSDGGTVALNQAPTIAGVPSRNILEGQFYEFIPDASDPDLDALEFSIARKPAWASFDRSTGRLWGTPDAADVGNFTNISISVSDGQEAAALTAFDISVNPIAMGSATVSWLPPTENHDGSLLTDLAGYRIYYGRDQNNLSQVIELDNPGLTRHVVENLTPARWYFQMTALDTAGAESARSPAASKTIS